MRSNDKFIYKIRNTPFQTEFLLSKILIFWQRTYFNELDFIDPNQVHLNVCRLILLDLPPLPRITAIDQNQLNWLPALVCTFIPHTLTEIDRKLKSNSSISCLPRSQLRWNFYLHFKGMLSILSIFVSLYSLMLHSIEDICHNRSKWRDSLGILTSYIPICHVPQNRS